MGILVKQIMEQRNLSPDEIDAIIVATITPDMMFPSTAALIQKNIKAVNAWGYDLSSACSGFLYALQMGSQFIQTGTNRIGQSKLAFPTQTSSRF